MISVRLKSVNSCAAEVSPTPRNQPADPNKCQQQRDEAQKFLIVSVQRFQTLKCHHNHKNTRHSEVRHNDRRPPA